MKKLWVILGVFMIVLGAGYYLVPEGLLPGMETGVQVGGMGTFRLFMTALALIGVVITIWGLIAKPKV